VQGTCAPDRSSYRANAYIHSYNEINARVAGPGGRRAAPSGRRKPSAAPSGCLGRAPVRGPLATGLVEVWARFDCRESECVRVPDVMRHIATERP
jgi:hypothetical protein